MNIGGWLTDAALHGSFPIRWPWVIGVFGPAAVNGLLGSPKSDLASILTYAVYAGELIVLASWLACRSNLVGLHSGAALVVAVSLLVSFWARVGTQANSFLGMQHEYVEFAAASGIVMLCLVLAALLWRSLGYRLTCRRKT